MLERAIVTDPRHGPSLEALRRQWKAADVAFRAMVECTGRAQRWLATRHAGAADGRDARAQLAAELVAVETEAHRTKCEAYAAAVELAATMLEAVSSAYADESVDVQGAPDRSTEAWMAAIFQQITSACQAAGSPVTLFDAAA